MPTEAKESIPQRDKIREQAQIQSRVLIESLPYLRRYQDQIIVINISGRGDKDCVSIARYRGEELSE